MKPAHVLVLQPYLFTNRDFLSRLLVPNKYVMEERPTVVWVFPGLCAKFTPPRLVDD